MRVAPFYHTHFCLVLGEAQRELNNDENRERLKQVLDMALGKKGGIPNVW